mgnify:CR=1 FL=1
MAKIKSCGGVVYDVKKEQVFYLIIQNKMSRKYGFPKGHMEAGETKVETAKREIFEETGHLVKLYEDLYEKSTYMLGEDLKEVTYFLARTDHQNSLMQLSEISDLKWLTYEAALEVLNFKKDQEILANMHEKIKKIEGSLT